MDIKEAAHSPAAAQSVGTGDAGGGFTARRRLLAAGIAGAATSLLPWLNRSATASGSGTGSTTDDTTAATTGETSGDDFASDTTNASDITTGGTESATDPTDPNADTGDTQPPTGGAETTVAEEQATTTTEPPRRPTDADVALLDFAQSVELTIRDLYDVAIDGGAFDDVVLADMQALREAHEGYATAISGVIGRDAGNVANSVLFGQMQAEFGGADSAAAATSLAALEDAAVATHLEILGELVGTDAASLIASIAVVEARHATLLKTVAGATDLADQLAFDSEALSPTDYPVE